MLRPLLCVITLWIGINLPAVARGQLTVTPPLQPPMGPGGTDYPHRGVTARSYGSGGTQYWRFEPHGPQLLSAPLIIFVHGWGALHPRAYNAWIAHLVKRGHIVVYPRYQADRRTATHEFTPKTLNAVQEAIRRLWSEPGHVRPDLSKTAVVGHSAGGVIAANLAALAGSFGLPVPQAVMCVQPGKTWNTIQRLAIPLADLSQVPAPTLLLAVVSDQDTLARDIDAKRIVTETTQIASTNKNLIQVRSDKHGVPALRATHFMPLAFDSMFAWSGGPALPRKEPGPASKRTGKQGSPSAGAQASLQESATTSADLTGLSAFRVMELGVVDALDFYGLWKLFDALYAAAFDGQYRDYALGNTSSQRFMGLWSDGTPVKELSVLDATVTPRRTR